MRSFSFVFSALFLCFHGAVVSQQVVSQQVVSQQVVTQEAVTQEAGGVRVATHYFYWYRWPKEHFRGGRKGHEGHFHHFTAPEKVSYTDPAWHRRQFEDMAACGIDFALPVYWGAPGAYDRPNLRFSRAGLPPMVEALEQIEASELGKPSVKLGLFYDTSTLRCDVRGVKPAGGSADLTTTAGQRLFARTVIEYFEQIPKRFWARVRGRALVVLYTSAFASRFDETLGPTLRAAFSRRFSDEGVFLVADESWGEIGQDRTTGWGAALNGPVIHPGVAQIGPGYDDSPVPGRRTPSRPREDGDFYRWSWHRAIASKPELVILETWNEMHEGTEICETKETGRAYLELTREWIRYLRHGEVGPAVVLRYSEPKPRADRSWGAEAAGRIRVFVDYTGRVPKRVGLREIDWADGAHRIERRSLRPQPSVGTKYIYFQVSDFFCFDTDQRLEVVVDAEPIGGPVPHLDYDSREAKAPVSGAYLRVSGRAIKGRGEAGRLLFDLPEARLANRQNGGADFRLYVPDVRTAIRRIEVRTVPDPDKRIR